MAPLSTPREKKGSTAIVTSESESNRTAQNSKLFVTVDHSWARPTNNC